jgi:uncharacterized YigZ family protein
MKDEYQSIKGAVSASLKVEGSKFIAGAFPVQHRGQAEETLAKLRKEYYDATHHCFAYALGIEGKEFRYSDDGEPSGTAGAKILAAIQSKELSDILIVVTRYFGGTKLGTGGLGRAYFESAARALAEAVVVQKVVAEELQITFPYDETSRVMNTLLHSKTKIIDTIYDDDVTLRISVRKNSVRLVIDELVNVTRGNLAVKNRGT